MQRIACAAGGEEDGLAFLPGANPAGRRRDLLGERWATAGERQGTLSPAPLLKGLRPLRIPLWRRILCAAEGGMGLRFYLGANPAGRRRDLLGGAMGDGGETAGDAVPCTPAQGSKTLENPTAATHFMRRGGGDGLAFLPGANPAGRRRDLLVFMELSYEKARRIEGICRAKRLRHVEKGSSSEMHRPPQPGVVDNPARRTPARRRGQPFATTSAPRRGRPSVAHDSCQPPISQPKTANPAVVRRDLPRVET